jgi:hypothetical protein
MGMGSEGRRIGSTGKETPTPFSAVGSKFISMANSPFGLKEKRKNIKTSALSIFDLRSSIFVNPFSPPGSGFKEANAFVKEVPDSSGFVSVIVETLEKEDVHPVWRAREAEMILRIGSENFGPPFFKDFKKSILGLLLGGVSRKVSFSFGISGRSPFSGFLTTVRGPAKGGES